MSLGDVFLIFLTSYVYICCLLPVLKSISILNNSEFYNNMEFKNLYYGFTKIVNSLPVFSRVTSLLSKLYEYLLYVPGNKKGFLTIGDKVNVLATRYNPNSGVLWF